MKLGKKYQSKKFSKAKKTSMKRTRIQFNMKKMIEDEIT
jgi:hypothetical protein